MNTSKDDLIRLIKASGAFTDEQKAQLIESAPKLNEEQIKNLKVEIFKLGEAQIEAAKKALAVEELIHRFDQEDQKAEMHEQEVAERKDEIAAADKLLNDL